MSSPRRRGPIRRALPMLHHRRDIETVVAMGPRLRGDDSDIGGARTSYSLLTTHYSLLTTHYSLLTTHYSLLTTHYSLIHLVDVATSPATTVSTFSPSRTKSCPCTITRALSGMPVTHMKVCSSSATRTGTKPTTPSSFTARTPMSPLDEIVSPERGIRVAATGAWTSETSAVMPSGMIPAGFAISTSTR